MRKEDLFEALQDIDDEKILAAKGKKKAKKPVWIRWIAVAACAAVITGVFAAVPLLRKGGQSPAGGYPSEIGVVSAVYPEATAVNLSAQQFMESDDHWEWWQDFRERADASRALYGGMKQYYSELMAQTLVAEDDNPVCSPINTYIAFAMLAEVTDGNTRQQILDLLGVPDIETLRQNIKVLWEGNYADTPTLKSILANSAWLRDGYAYDADTLARLAGDYYASSFSGVPGSEQMNGALRSWTDRNTGGLLTEYIQDMKLDSDTVFALVSTIYYKAQWTAKFQQQSTSPETFHGTKGNAAVDMMHMSDMMSVYSTESFTALGLSLMDSGSMFFYLPNEGTDVNGLASDAAVLKATEFDYNDNAWSSPLVHLSVPKFSVSGSTDLIEVLQDLGITDVLDPDLADFSPLTQESDSLFLSAANHAALVEIDEEGVTGAAYTELAVAEGAPIPDGEIDFVLDRPFMFIVTGNDGSVLFSGIVRNIEG